MTVRLTTPTAVLDASVIHLWTSKPEESRAIGVKFLARTVFERVPGAARLLYLWTGKVPLFLIGSCDGRWFDMAGQPVKVTAQKGDLACYLNTIAQHHRAEPPTLTGLDEAMSGLKQIKGLGDQLSIDGGEA